MKMKQFDKPAVIMAGVGAVNWGFVEFTNFNVVDLFASVPFVPTLVYGAIAIAGFLTLKKGVEMR